MEFIDYYVKKMENIKNKFVVYIVHSDSESDSEMTTKILKIVSMMY